MSIDLKAALFLMLGQVAEKEINCLDDIVPKETLLLSSTYDLAAISPDRVRRSAEAAEVYRLFFVFEDYLREFVVEVLSKDTTGTWWDKIPADVRLEISKLEETEEIKSWMALGSRDKSTLMTLPQLIRVIDQQWKEGFDEIVRDKGLIHEARLIVHLRNTICHMSTISEEEADRVRQTMRDWFRVVSP